MNKTEFLDELKNHLAVLEEKEQQDILEEYTQHIDMKMESGLSEEDAIRDFGELGQLAAEILEAYHVNPHYYGNSDVSRGFKAGGAVRKARTGLMGIVRAAGRFLHRMSAACGRNACDLFMRVRTFLSRITARRPHMVSRFSSGKKNGLSRQLAVPGSDRWSDQGAVPNTGRDTGKEDGMYAGRGRGIVRNAVRSTGASIWLVLKSMFCGLGVFFSACLSMAVWCLFFCLRWTWNVLLFMLSLFSGCLALFSLYLMAVFLVWMVQGYPFAGPALLSLGCVLCGGSFSILCISLLRLRRNTKSTAVSDVSGHNTSEEVQHA